jgi:protein tyrosine/serine phosphatase
LPSGRDRTGIIAAFLLLLAGVDKQAVADDYAISNMCIQPTYTKTLYKNLEKLWNTPFWDVQELELADYAWAV